MQKPQKTAIKKPKLKVITYNLPEDICEKVSQAAIDDDRSASNWLTIHLEQHFNQQPQEK